MSSLLLHPFVMLASAASRAQAGSGLLVRPSTSNGLDMDMSRASRPGRPWDEKVLAPSRLDVSATEGEEAHKARRVGSTGGRAASALASRVEASEPVAGSRLRRATVDRLDLGKAVPPPSTAPSGTSARAPLSTAPAPAAEVAGDPAGFESYAVLSARSDLSGTWDKRPLTSLQSLSPVSLRVGSICIVGVGVACPGVAPICTLLWLSP